MLSVSYDPPFVPEPLQTSNPDHPLMRWAKRNEVASFGALADLLGISRPRLSQIISRKHRPAPNLALKIYQVTKLPIEDLLTLTAAEVRAGITAGWERKPTKRRRRK